VGEIPGTRAPTHRPKLPKAGVIVPPASLRRVGPNFHHIPEFVPSINEISLAVELGEPSPSKPFFPPVSTAWVSCELIVICVVFFTALLEHERIFSHSDSTNFKKKLTL